MRPALDLRLRRKRTLGHGGLPGFGSQRGELGLQAVHFATEMLAGSLVVALQLGQWDLASPLPMTTS